MDNQLSNLVNPYVKKLWSIFNQYRLKI